jgi:hypothetical protein
MHGLGNMQFSQMLVRNFFMRQGLRYDANCLTSELQYLIRYHPHNTDTGTSVNQPDVSADQ